MFLIFNSLQQILLPIVWWDGSVRCRPEHSLPPTWSARACPHRGGHCGHLWGAATALPVSLSRDPCPPTRTLPPPCPRTDLPRPQPCAASARSPRGRQTPAAALPRTRQPAESALLLPLLMCKPEWLLHPRLSWDPLPRSALAWQQFRSTWGQRCRGQFMTWNSMDSSTISMRGWSPHGQIASRVSIQHRPQL